MISSGKIILPLSPLPPPKPSINICNVTFDGDKIIFDDLSRIYYTDLKRGGITRSIRDLIKDEVAIQIAMQNKHNLKLDV